MSASDEETNVPPTQEHDEEIAPKTEDANAPINIKVCPQSGRVWMRLRLLF